MRTYTTLLFLCAALFSMTQASIVQKIKDFEKTITRHPNDAQNHYAYACYLADLDMPLYYQSSLIHFKKALALNPTELNWLFRYGTFCCRVGRFKDSLEAYIKILSKKKHLVPILYNSSFTFKTAGLTDMAIALYKKIIAADPSHEQAHLGLAFALLCTGKFKEGWHEHAWNLKNQGKNADNLRVLLAENNLAGKTILLTPEGGLGDTIHFVRYAQRLGDKGAEVIVAAQAPLIPLLSGCPFIDRLLPINTKKPAHDASATLMSLPAIFADSKKNVPKTIPYIFPPKERIEYWRQYMKDDSNIKIGICWQPNMHNDISRLPIARRGIPLALFGDLAALPNVTLYSLQQKEGLDQLKDISSLFNIHIFDDSFDVTHGSFIDTAAVIQNLDLVISTDTATAHLAGALGKPVWLLLPYASDWRWILGKKESPWYPTMHIFKQSEPFDWESVIDDVLDVFKKEYL